MNELETVALSHLNNSLELKGSQERRYIDIREIIVEEGDPNYIKLVILDEKDIPIFSEILTSINRFNNSRIQIDKKFVFYDHLTVQLLATSPDTAFAVSVVFE